MQEEDKSKVEIIIKKQKKMGKLLLKEIKNDNSKKNRNIGAITIKYMNLLKNDNKTQVEGKVSKQALLYAKSILEGKEFMKNLVKTTTNVIQLLDDWKEIEVCVNQKSKKSKNTGLTKLIQNKYF